MGPDLLYTAGHNVGFSGETKLNKLQSSWNTTVTINLPGGYPYSFFD